MILDLQPDNVAIDFPNIDLWIIEQIFSLNKWFWWASVKRARPTIKAPSADGNPSFPIKSKLHFLFL